MKCLFITLTLLTGTAFAWWQIETVDGPDVVGIYTSLALDSSGYPHISYIDESNMNLKYAFWNGSSWEIETVDHFSGIVLLGSFTSLALDSSGNPHISYHYHWYYDLKYVPFDSNLRYAFWNGSSWEIETVDGPGDVGRYSSLALDSSGYPHISYFDNTNYDLKYARQTETGIGGGSDYSLGLFPITPNPTSGTFSVEFVISECTQVRLWIYDMNGRLVRHTPSSIYSSGLHQINFSDLETGIYLCRMTSGDFTETQQFVVIE